MSKLKIGQEVEMQYGGYAKILDVIGSGGQGIVYLAEYNGLKFALKWYDISKIKKPDDFLGNLRKNIHDGSPSDKFIWPKYLTKKDSDGTFGYLMNLIPKHFVSFVDILNTYKIEADPASGRICKKNIKFASLYAMVNSFINIANAFRQLHRTGKSYQDLNEGGFFFDTDTGDVLICDCDNIAPDGKNFGIGGKAGYMAPEIINGTARPNVQTDKYSLAVIFFKLLFRGEPMEGCKNINNPYCSEKIFVFDPDNDTNRPVAGIHNNVINFWNLYPDYIKNAFIISFTDGLRNPNKRIIENEWQNLFIRLRSEIITCKCGRTEFSSMFETIDNKIYKCKKCGTSFKSLEICGHDYRIPLFKGRNIYKCEIYPQSDDFMSISAKIVANSSKPDLLGIKNCSDKKWRVKCPDNFFYYISPQMAFPVWEGLEIDFDGIKAKC